MSYFLLRLPFYLHFNPSEIIQILSSSLQLCLTVDVVRKHCVIFELAILFVLAAHEIMVHLKNDGLHKRLLIS